MIKDLKFPIAIGMERTDFAFKRKYPRRNLHAKVCLLHAGRCDILDSAEVSEGGMSLKSTKKYAVGEWIVVSFHIKGNRFMSVRGEVVYNRPSPEVSDFNVVGIKFENLKFEYKRFIREYIAEKTELEMLQETG